MLDYAVNNGLSTIAITDHYWDERVPGASFNGPYTSGTAIWYAMQNTGRTDLALPLPEAPGVRFLYGCETEMDKHCRIGISREEMERRAFIIIPTTHLHMGGFTLERDQNSEAERAMLWEKRLAALLDMDLPFHKIGIAHLNCALFSPQKNAESTAKCLSLISDESMKDLFGKAAKCGVGIELNFSVAKCGEYLEELLRPFRIAAECGCRFYLGSDAHTPGGFEGATENFGQIVTLLDLSEDQKFVLK
jgi:histidinol phosphatase-like PHP family hydrolase